MAVLLSGEVVDPLFSKYVRSLAAWVEEMLVYTVAAYYNTHHTFICASMVLSTAPSTVRSAAATCVEVGTALTVVEQCCLINKRARLAFKDDTTRRLDAGYRCQSSSSGVQKIISNRKLSVFHCPAAAMFVPLQERLNILFNYDGPPDIFTTARITLPTSA
jgi:hypothetical protein